MSPEKVITTLKGQFFLSPRERNFINFLTRELGIPRDVLSRALEECLKSVPPEKRRNFPVFKCFRKVLELAKLKERQDAIRRGLKWKEIFREKLLRVRKYMDEMPKEPSNEEEAEKVLKEIESKIMKKLWESLSVEEKKRIVSKYKNLKHQDEELFKELVKYELRKIYKIPELSIYVR